MTSTTSTTTVEPASFSAARADAKNLKSAFAVFLGRLITYNGQTSDDPSPKTYQATAFIWEKAFQVIATPFNNWKNYVNTKRRLESIELKAAPTCDARGLISQKHINLLENTISDSLIGLITKVALLIGIIFTSIASFSSMTTLSIVGKRIIVMSTSIIVIKAIYNLIRNPIGNLASSILSQIGNGQEPSNPSSGSPMVVAILVQQPPKDFKSCKPHKT